MRSKTLFVGIVIGLLLAAGGIVVAGSLDPSAGPMEAGSQMYTLEQIYTRLASGGNATKATMFTEPGSGPGSTMHTLDDIYPLTWPARVPKTGAGTIAGYTLVAGEDGLLQKGVAWPPSRFTDNGDGTVTDNLTGLMWMKNADAGNDCNGADAGMEDWATALASAAACNAGAGYAGHTDWRLPNVRELHSLVDYGQTNPALSNPNPFTGVQPTVYWSSTTVPPPPLHQHVVRLPRSLLPRHGVPRREDAAQELRVAGAWRTMRLGHCGGA